MRLSYLSLFFCLLFLLFSHPAFAENPGTCKGARQGGGRTSPIVGVVTEDKCNAGYKPSVDISSTTTTCTCVAVDAPTCSKKGANCTDSSECSSGAGCSSFTCIGYVQGKTPGRCEVPPPPASGGSSGSQPLPNPCDTNGDYTQCDTALGPLAATPENFIKSAYTSILSMSGGIAVLLIIMSGYEMMTSQGNPEKVKGAQERLTAAIVGLLFIIFSFVILQVIGIDILDLPGLT